MGINNEEYERKTIQELDEWVMNMKKEPSTSSLLTSNFQERVNRLIPEKIHQAMTAAIREVTRGVIMGSEFTTLKKKSFHSLEEQEQNIIEKINVYKSSAAAEGAVTGFGGILLGLADFPLWLTLKMKMLFTIANNYGFNTKDLHERLFILYIFEMTFSSQNHRNTLIEVLENWDAKRESIPEDLRSFDWKTFQLQYRDHIDLRKLIQLIPGVGAVVGAVVNHQLTEKLGNYAMNAYRLRLFHDSKYS